MTTYTQFLARKTARIETPGRTITPGDVHPLLHPYHCRNRCGKLRR